MIIIQSINESNKHCYLSYAKGTLYWSVDKSDALDFNTIKEAIVYWNNIKTETQYIGVGIKFIENDVPHVEACSAMEEKNLVNHPPHYQSWNGIECIDAIEAALTPDEYRGFIKGQLMKYSWRSEKKNGEQDLRKANWYSARYQEYKNKIVGIVAEAFKKVNADDNIISSPSFKPWYIARIPIWSKGETVKDIKFVYYSDHHKQFLFTEDKSISIKFADEKSAGDVANMIWDGIRQYDEFWEAVQ